MAPSARNQQLVDAPLGRHFTSPKKRNRHATRSGREKVIPLGRDARLNGLQARLRSLCQPDNTPTTHKDGEHVAIGQDCEWEDLADSEQPPPDEGDPTENMEGTLINPSGNGMPENTPKRSRVVPDSRTLKLYDRWQALLSILEGPYLAYIAESTKRPTSTTFSSTKTGCISGCDTAAYVVLMLFWDREYPLHHLEQTINILLRLRDPYCDRMLVHTTAGCLSIRWNVPNIAC